MNAVAPAPVATLPVLDFQNMFAAPESVGPPKSLIIHGEPGTRKTTIAGSLIKVDGFDKILYIDIDNGTEVFQTDDFIKSTIGIDRGAPGEKRINITPISKLDPQAFHKVQYLIDAVTTQDLGYDAVVIDALDVLQEVGVKHLLATVVNEKGVLDSRKAWGEVSVWITDMMWKLQNAPHIVGVSVMHSKVDAEESGALKIKPKLQGSAKDSIAGIPSLVAYVEFKTDAVTKETKLVATVGGSSVITAKNRYRLDNEIEDFDLPKLYSMIEGKPLATVPDNQPAILIPAA